MKAIEPKKSLVEETYDALLDAICRNELRPGDRLNQDELAARLNVSRQPVNSAIAILKADRLVEETGRRGVAVAAVDPDLVRSICEYRLTVEPWAVRLAAARLPARAAAEAGEIMARGRAAADAGDMRGLLGADRAFHAMIYGWSGNLVIQSSMYQNWNHIQRTMADILRDRTRAQAVWDEHAAILAALLSGDADGAADGMVAHLRSAYARNFLPLPAERGTA